MIQRLVNKFCWGLTRKFPDRYRIIHTDGKRYLLRFYVKRNGKLPGLYLHHFFRGDMDRDLHDHPWNVSGSLILTGGYLEERLDPDTKEVYKRKIRPGRLNIIRANDFHRVDLLTGRAWTLFMSGKKVKDWGFYIRETGEYIPHSQYLSEKERVDND